MKRFWGAVAALFLLSLVFAIPQAHAANCPGFSYTLINGQTADATQVMSNFNTVLNCANNSLAHNGANADITSLTGLTTPLSASQGGTGQTASIFSGPNSWTGVQTWNQANVHSGAETHSGIEAHTGAETHTGQETWTGTTTNYSSLFTNIAEPVTVSATAANTAVNFDTTTQSVLYYTSNASANWSINLRGNGSTTLSSLLAVGQSVTVAFLVPQGATGYYNTAIQVDGTTTGVTAKWQNGAPTVGDVNTIDVYTYTIIKTAATPTYTILATVGAFQ